MFETVAAIADCRGRSSPMRQAHLRCWQGPRPQRVQGRTGCFGRRRSAVAWGYPLLISGFLAPAARYPLSTDGVGRRWRRWPAQHHAEGATPPLTPPPGGRDASARGRGTLFWGGLGRSSAPRRARPPETAQLSSPLPQAGARRLPGGGAGEGACWRSSTWRPPLANSELQCTRRVARWDRHRGAISGALMLCCPTHG